MVYNWWWFGGTRRWRNCAATLLAHVNLLLALYGGASLATAARLKWDPSTYVVAREVFPVEYRVTGAATVAAGALLLLLTHLALAALLTTSKRVASVLLCIYAVLMAALMVCELAFAAWLAQRLLAWLRSDTALVLLTAKRIQERLMPLLNFFGHFGKLPNNIANLINEAEADVPRNLYAVGGCALALGLLQSLATLMALYLACCSNTHTGNTPTCRAVERKKEPLHLEGESRHFVLVPRGAAHLFRAAPPPSHYSIPTE